MNMLCGYDNLQKYILLTLYIAVVLPTTCYGSWLQSSTTWNFQTALNQVVFICTRWYLEEIVELIWQKIREYVCILWSQCCLDIYFWSNRPMRKSLRNLTLARASSLRFAFSRIVRAGSRYSSRLSQFKPNSCQKSKVLGQKHIVK